jgi:putative DNA primase/helicase
MDFITFARLHGIVIDHEPRIGLWRRYATEDKPAHKNGAVKFMGDHAFIQNHATMVEIAVWKADADAKLDLAKIRRIAQQADDDIKRKQIEAAKTAAWMLKESQIAHHPYLSAKGFPDEQGNIYVKDGVLLMLVPMRVSSRLVGVQIIDPEGRKKFLFGQKTSNAEFIWDNKGPHILCEGYATGLSIRAAMKALKRRYTLHVCFSAGNMEKIAAGLPAGFVVADNDASQTGLNTAKKIGWPYFMPPTEGQDFNDFAGGAGLFRSSQALAKALPLRPVQITSHNN